MGQEIELQTDLYEKNWFPMEQNFGNEYSSSFDWFMCDYLSVKTGTIPRIDRVYDEFKNYRLSNKSPETIKEVVGDIQECSGYYVKMVLHKEENEKLLVGFKNISRLKVDVSYPFFLPVYDDYVSGLINIDEFSEIITLVENYVFRRAICGVPTNSLNKTFAILYNSIRRDNYVESIKATFQLMDNYKRFP